MIHPFVLTRKFNVRMRERPDRNDPVASIRTAPELTTLRRVVRYAFGILTADPPLSEALDLEFPIGHP